MIGRENADLLPLRRLLLPWWEARVVKLSALLEEAIAANAPVVFEEAGRRYQRNADELAEMAALALDQVERLEACIQQANSA